LCPCRCSDLPTAMAAMAAMATMSARRMALTAAGVGAAAGCMGTWFEMSHGVVCIPVLTLPPFSLSQQVAIGSTAFGVAARQVLSASLYALDPGTEPGEPEGLGQLVDLDAALALAASSTLAALGGAALAARLPQRPMRRANGAFLVVVALFLQWREAYAKAGRPEDEEDGDARPAAAGTVPPSRPGEHGAVAREATAGSGHGLQQHLLFGAAAGSVLGFLGIGPAWMLAPLLSHTAPAPESAGGLLAGVGSPAQAAEASGASSEERVRRTCCLAMVPPSLAAAWRHFRLGHVVNAPRVALPLATGAILGSAVGGMQLADVPCEFEVRYGTSLLLFAYGCWSLVRP